MENNKSLDVLFQNAKLLKSREAITREQRKITITSLASTLCEDSEASLDETVKTFSLCDPTTEEKMILFEEMSRYPKLIQQIKNTFPLGSEERTTAGSHGKIAYVKNDINNAAYDQLCEKINNAKPVSAPSFSSACESVSEGENEFCMLPLENTSGKLLSFYSTIDRYELRIRAVCDVEDEHSQTIRYALLSKSCKWIPEKVKKQKFTFEFFLISQDASFLSDLTSASNACGAMLRGFDFMPVEYDSGLKRYLLCFDMYGRDILPFHAFLSLNYEAYVPLGFYTL